MARFPSGKSLHKTTSCPSISPDGPRKQISFPVISIVGGGDGKRFGFMDFTKSIAFCNHWFILFSIYGVFYLTQLFLDSNSVSRPINETAC